MNRRKARTQWRMIGLRGSRSICKFPIFRVCFVFCLGVLEFVMYRYTRNTRVFVYPVPNSDQYSSTVWCSYLIASHHCSPMCSEVDGKPSVGEQLVARPLRLWPDPRVSRAEDRAQQPRGAQGSLRYQAIPDRP